MEVEALPLDQALAGEEEHYSRKTAWVVEAEADHLQILALAVEVEVEELLHESLASAVEAEGEHRLRSLALEAAAVEDPL